MALPSGAKMVSDMRFQIRTRKPIWRKVGAEKVVCVMYRDWLKSMLQVACILEQEKTSPNLVHQLEPISIRMLDLFDK